MGGVDLSDQLVASYRRHMKSYTWYLQVFFHLVQLSGVQSYILHNELHPDAKLTQNKFLESLIEGLIGGRTYTQKRHGRTRETGSCEGGPGSGNTGTNVERFTYCIICSLHTEISFPRGFHEVTVASMTDVDIGQIYFAFGIGGGYRF